MSKKKLTANEIIDLSRVIDSCGEIRIEVGGVSKYHFLTDEEIITITSALEEAAKTQQEESGRKAGLNEMSEGNNKLEKFKKIEITDHWLYEIEKRVKKTIEAAENVMELDEDDITFILFSHANRMIGLGVIPAERSNELDDLILDNNLHR